MKNGGNASSRAYRIFITGSADGLGQLAVRRLVEQGHRVLLHARNRQRAQQALTGVPEPKASSSAIYRASKK